MNIKKIVTLCLASLLLLFLGTIFYFYKQYAAIDLVLSKIIQQEILKENPSFGYTFSASLDGQLISHSPLDKLTNNSIDALFDPSYKTKIINALSTIKNTKDLLLKDLKDRHGHHINTYLKLQNNHILGFIYFPNELKKFGINDERHSLILLSLSLMFLFCILILLIWIVTNTRRWKWWLCVGFISLGMVSEIWYLWSLRNSVGLKEDLESVPLLSQAQANNFFQKIKPDEKKSYTTIPTGIFIENGQFTLQGISDIFPGIFLKGYIWQRYSLPEHTSIEKGFIIANAHYLTTKKFYHHKNLNEEVICWSFNCCLYQNYNVTLYPFDHRHIMVNLLHKNFEQNIFLTPDFSSYDAIDSLMLPGISLKTLRLPHWNVSKSFFNFEFFNFKTDLGYSSFEHNKIPYLQFIITAQRTLGGSFIMYFILFFVVFIILFILLTAFLRQGTLLDIVGFSTLSVLGSCSGLLFVLITSEISLRETLQTEGIVYLEYIYFICYFAIIGIIINSILFAKGKPAFIIYQDNIIFKLLYWPSIFLAMVLITAYILY